MELPAATQKPDKAHALLFALELLFELLFALELLFELLFMELLFIIRPHGAVEFLKMRCCWCALLVICWLSARLCPGIMIADMYWQFCAEWQDRPGIITLEIMRAR